MEDFKGCSRYLQRGPLLRSWLLARICKAREQAASLRVTTLELKQQKLAGRGATTYVSARGPAAAHVGGCVSRPGSYLEGLGNDPRASEQFALFLRTSVHPGAIFRVHLVFSTDKKKGGKFQPFKKLFGKRKKRDPLPSRGESAGKKSYAPQSVSNGTFSSDEETPEDHLRHWPPLSAFLVLLPVSGVDVSSLPELLSCGRSSCSFLPHLLVTWSFNCSVGTRALSHDSIFIPDGGAESEQTVQA
uniref:Uncharacterized protein n=2 Tax=Chinchilla lanigera TaxID=34839 RepID=A0A8C2UX65_CHILA